VTATFADLWCAGFAFPVTVWLGMMLLPRQVCALSDSMEKAEMSKRTRRQFLEDSMFAAAATVAAGSANELMAEEETQSSSPNERLRVAVVGVRGRGGSHIGAFAGRKDTEVVYLCDPDREIGARRAQEVGKRQGGRAPQFVEDMRTAFDDPSVDIVSIATPNHWHALSAIWAMQSGKDVYVEKPVSHNVSEGRRMVQIARKHGKICQTGTQCRSNPGMIAAMDFVQSGKIGKVSVARGLCYKPRGSIGPRGATASTPAYNPPESVNYDLWLGPAPQAPLTRSRFHYDWHWQWPYGNGDLGNQGIHQMDLARWGLGVDHLSHSVMSYGGRFGYVDAGDTANTQVIVHDYGEQALVFEVRGLKTSGFKNARVGVIFEGSEGYLVMNSYDRGAAFDLDGEKIEEFSGGGNHFNNFLAAVRSRKHDDLNADIEEGHVSSALCHLGNISYRLGETVDFDKALPRLEQLSSSENVAATLERTLGHLRDNGIDLKKTQLQLGSHLPFDPSSETFQDNERADQMLTRVYREPFVVPSEVV
jgi:predicted dehydrogenase